MKNKPTPVLYLDLDGTVRKGYDQLGKFVNKAEDVEIFPNAIALMRAYKNKGYRIVGVSNQGGVALGYTTYDDCHKAMVETERQCHGLFDTISFCIHHPDAKQQKDAICWCRKPLPGLVIEAALALEQKYAETYPPYLALFVGDMKTDRECAALLNIQFMDAEAWRKQDPSTI